MSGISVGTAQDAAPRLAGLVAAALIIAAAGPARLTMAHGRLDPTGRYEIRWWTVDDGLPETPLQGIAAAADGTIVCGSRSRIVRFDGIRFRPLRQDVTAKLHAAIGDFWALGFDGQGRLWVQGRQAVACLVDDPESPRVRWEVHRLGDVVLTGLTFTKTGRPLCIGRDALLVNRDGRFETVAVTSSEGGTWQFGEVDPRSGDLWLWQGEGSDVVLRVANAAVAETAWPAHRVDASSPVATIGFGPEGAWAVTADAVCHHRDDGWKAVANLPKTETQRLRGKIRQAPDGTLWVSSHDALTAFKGGDVEAVIGALPGFSQYTHRLLVTPDGTVWAACSGGLLCVRRTGVTVDRVPGCTAVFERADGSLLVGSPGGITVLHAKSGATDPVASLAPQAVPTSILETADGCIWVGTQDAFIHRISDGRITQVTHAASEPFRELRSTTALTCDSSGRIWAGTANGLALYDPVAGGFELVSGHGAPVPVRIIGLAADHDGGLLVAATGRGVDRIGPDGRSRRLVRWPSMPGGRSAVFRRDSRGTLWVGGDRGLLRLAGNGTTFLVSRATGLVDDCVRQIDEDSHGRLWVATKDGHVQGMRLEDLEALAAGGRKLVRGIVLHVGAGLDAAECIGTTGRLPSGKPTSTSLVVPLEGGVARFPPPRTFPGGHGDGPPTLTLTRDAEHGRPRFTLASPGMHLDAQPLHQTRLRGIEPAWSEPTTEETRQYEALPAGNYVFEARRVAGETDADFPSAMLPVDVPLPWWRRPWAVAIQAVTLVVVAASFSRWFAAVRARRIIASLEMQRARDRERARIARDIHDSLGAGLTRMALMTENARRSGSTGESLHARLDAIYRDAHDLTRSVDEIVWAVNPVNDTLAEFVSFTMQDVEDFARAGDLALRLDVPTDLPDVRIDAGVRHHLCLAIREAAQNVLRHAQAKCLEFTVRLQAGSLIVSIADDGCGFHPERHTAEGQDGLRNIRSRIRDVGGTCTIDSTPGRGTRVTLTVPLTALATGHGRKEP